MTIEDSCYELMNNQDIINFGEIIENVFFAAPCSNFSIMPPVLGKPH